MNFTVNIPEAGDSFGRWCERHNVSFEMSCQLGRWHATASRRAVHSYSDRRGMHREEWVVTKVHEEPSLALTEALDALAQSSGIETFVECAGRELAEASS
jgi:hypothetical protein